MLIRLGERGGGAREEALLYSDFDGEWVPPPRMSPERRRGHYDECQGIPGSMCRIPPAR